MSCAARRRKCWRLSVTARAASLRLSSQVDKQRTVLVAPAWPYANGPRHIGHAVGFAEPAHVLARLERLRGSRDLIASGAGEHGPPITYEAEKDGNRTRDFVERNNALIVG